METSEYNNQRHCINSIQNKKQITERLRVVFTFLYVQVLTPLNLYQLCRKWKCFPFFLAYRSASCMQFIAIPLDYYSEVLYDYP